MIFQGEIELSACVTSHNAGILGKWRKILVMMVLWYLLVCSFLSTYTSNFKSSMWSSVSFKVWSLINSPQLDCSGFTATAAAAAQKSGAKNGKHRVTSLKRSSKCFWRALTNAAFLIRTVIYSRIIQLKINFLDLNLDGKNVWDKLQENLCHVYSHTLC